jgi:hypothetical protein
MAVNALTTWVARPAAPSLCESATHAARSSIPRTDRRVPSLIFRAVSPDMSDIAVRASPGAAAG